MESIGHQGPHTFLDDATARGGGWIYRAENVSGNLFSLVSYINKFLSADVIEIVHMESDGHNGIVVWRQPRP
jgi:hypothetical protein